MPEITVRPATSRDFTAASRLLTELGRPAPNPDTLLKVQQGYEDYLARPDVSPLVAVLEGEIVGFMSLEFRYRLNHADPQAWIPDLVVADEHRGKGAGRALLNRGFELARERGCWGVTLESGHQRTVAHALYRSAGMTEGGYYFTLKL
ncbi:MAG: GNAT family N-acetyltransferase [Chloroflexi bacterium]|nr:GNAT family N-acetyltransferase [Chloroflexota bacterium]